MNEYYFEKCDGGGSSGSSTPTILISNAVTLLGKRFPVTATVSEIYGYLSDATDILSNYSFDQTNKKYNIRNATNAYAKQIGSTWDALLYKKNSALKVRARLVNVTFALNKKPKIYFQTQLYVRDCIRTGNDELISFYFGQALK